MRSRVVPCQMTRENERTGLHRIHQEIRDMVEVPDMNTYGPRLSLKTVGISLEFSLTAWGNKRPGLRNRFQKTEPQA